MCFLSERKSRRLTIVEFLFVACLATALAEYNSTQNPNVKNLTAGGHFYGLNEYGGEYGRPNNYNENINGKNPNIHFLVDDFVCDYDASILVVTNSDTKTESTKNITLETRSYNGHGSYGNQHTNDYLNDGSYGRPNNNIYNNDNSRHNDNYGNQAIAHRLRCSVVAVHSENACTTCCQLAARRDRSIAKERIVGFIANNDEINLKDENNSSETTEIPVTSESQTYRNIKNFKNLEFLPKNQRCMCCAPKHYLNHQNSNIGGHNGYNSPNKYQNNENYGNLYNQGYQQPYGGNYDPQAPPLNGYNAPPVGGYGQ